MVSAEADHYAVLGVSRAATPSEIRAAYKKRALATHPDKGGDASSFQAVGAAFAVLGDPERRRRYDEKRAAGTGPGARADPPFDSRAAHAQFARFFGDESPWAAVPDPPRTGTVVQISTVKRRDGSMQSLRREAGRGQPWTYSYFDHGDPVHGGSGHLGTGIAGIAPSAAPASQRLRS